MERIAVLGAKIEDLAAEDRVDIYCFPHEGRRKLEIGLLLGHGREGSSCVEVLTELPIRPLLPRLLPPTSIG